MDREVQETPAAIRCMVLAMLAIPTADAETPSQPIDAVDAMAFEQASVHSQSVYLEVMLNGEPLPSLLRFSDLGGRLFVDRSTLDAMGLDMSKVDTGRMDEVALDALQGLTYRYDAASQRVDIDADWRLRGTHTVNARQVQEAPSATSGRGFLVNYDALVQSDAHSRAALWSEQRYFDQRGVFSNIGVAYVNTTRRRYIRFDTSWSHSDPASLTTIQLGDFISTSLTWSRSVRMAGWQWRSNFALRPDLVTFPLPTLSGSAAVPSSVDVYINNVRQMQTEVPSGPFDVIQVPGITGAGQATLVTRDALGRLSTTVLPLYVDSRLLTKGLSSHSMEVGLVRRRYGWVSNDYASSPSGSGSVRYGVSNRLTLEGHAEGASGLFNGGAGALLGLGSVGVVNGALAVSRGRWRGSQLNLGYQWISPRLSISVEATRSFGRYGDLAVREGAPVLASTEQVSFALPFGGQQTWAVSYIGYKLPGRAKSRVGSMSYNVTLSRRMSMFVSGYRDFARSRDQGFFAGFNIALDDRISVNLAAGRQDGRPYTHASALRSPDYDGGWGWSLQSGGSSGSTYRQAQLQRLGSVGQWNTTVDAMAGRRTASMEWLGAVVFMDGRMKPARTVQDAFALVSTSGQAGVPVLHDNRVIGTTDGGGHFLVPDLNAYQINRVSIDAMNIPLGAQIEQTRMAVVPQAQSGVLARFGITHRPGAYLLLRDVDGKPLPPGLRVRHAESGAETVTGYDGATYVEDVHASNRLIVEGPGRHCIVRFDASPLNGPGTQSAEHLTCHSP
ncbi:MULTISPECIES: fimbria/pilus outer membrane usher protein [Dyella]|uniref:Fimbrial biogenesis outer membrane usher protein n=2 Tax=Dyella TaxID=231454 RepID=A0A4R0Z0Z4_9GAMM|nr:MULTISPECIES: fimbria/pilus outer membrane usher protein [Dyella]TBR39592.1 fimbrial biogenesis outer membrane usher protein [Dyella terrae]TCI12826.1 fimbrial biogenesis outer membrane usher protein [Dyella soli]